MKAVELAEVLVSLVGEQGSLACTGCGQSSDQMWGHGTSAIERGTALIEHAAFEHATRADITLVRPITTLSSNELGALLNLPPVTQAEANWRAEQALKSIDPWSPK